MLCNVSSEAPYLGLCSSPILIRATHVNAVVAAGFAVAGVAVRAEHAANDVPKVGHIVDVGQGTGNKNVSGTYAAMLQVVQTLIPA